jgi:hypothetical protein
MRRNAWHLGSFVKHPRLSCCEAVMLEEGVRDHRHQNLTVVV